MKTQQNKIILNILFIGMFIIFFSSCKPEKVTSPSNAVTGKLMLHMHCNIDNTEVEDYDTVYETNEGRKISLSVAQFYISEIQLVKLDGTTYDLGDKIVLKALEEEEYFLGDVPVGNYKSIRFKVGLNPNQNLKSNSDPSDSGLFDKPEMWFESNPQPAGYIFMNVQGSIDTSSNLSGTRSPFVYRIGTNQNYVQVNMPDKNLIIEKNQVEFEHLHVDISKLFTNIELNKPINLSVNTPADNTSLLAQQIKDNIPLMFEYEF